MKKPVTLKSRLRGASALNSGRVLVTRYGGIAFFGCAL